MIEAGAFGPDLEAQLQREGFSLGHDPDSFEFSTLGGKEKEEEESNSRQLLDCVFFFCL